jgi:hypothetical protein
MWYPSNVGQGFSSLAPPRVQVLARRRAARSNTLPVRRLLTRFWNLVLKRASIPEVPAMHQLHFNSDWTPQPRALDFSSPPRNTPTEPQEHSPEAFEHDSHLEVSFRHSGWQPTRRKVERAFQRTAQSLWRRNAFASCGMNAWVEESVDDPGVFRLRCDRCHDRFCVPCARERSHTIAANVRQYAADRTLRFITLTLRSTSEPLALLLNRLYDSFAKLRRYRCWLNTQQGGCAFLEIKWNPSRNRWHPHLHILAEGRYLAQPALKKAWRKATGDSFVVDIRAVRNLDIVTAYVVKYASKPLDGSFLSVPDRLDEAINALVGRKLCLTFGTWRGLALCESPERGTWRPICSLTDLLKDARDGDTEAQHIIHRLQAVVVFADSRSPPTDDLPLLRTL